MIYNLIFAFPEAKEKGETENLREITVVGTNASVACIFV